MTRQLAPHQVRFSIGQLNAWAPGVTTVAEWQEWARGERTIEHSGEPALHQMPAMLRRHAGRLGRIACTPAYETLRELRDLPMVFSSRYGDVSRSVELLTALSAEEELSPTTFGLSVHNAVPGLFSMARKETANSISLSAGDECAEYGVIEACGLLADGAEQVLLLVADCPLPQIYQEYEDTEPFAYGWSCLIKPPSVDILTLSWLDNGPINFPLTNSWPGPLAALSVLLGEFNEITRSSAVGQNVSSDTKLNPLAHRVWHWSRNA